MRCWCVLQGRAVLPPCVQRWTHRRQNEEEAAASPFRFKGGKVRVTLTASSDIEFATHTKIPQFFFFLPLRRAALQAKKGDEGDHISLTHFCRIISTLSFPPPRLASKRERGREEQKGKEGERGENHFSHLLAVVILLLLLLPLPPSPPSSLFPLHMRGGGVKNRDRQRDRGGRKRKEIHHVLTDKNRQMSKTKFAKKLLKSISIQSGLANSTFRPSVPPLLKERETAKRAEEGPFCRGRRGRGGGPKPSFLERRRRRKEEGTDRDVGKTRGEEVEGWRRRKLLPSTSPPHPTSASLSKCLQGVKRGGGGTRNLVLWSASSKVCPWCV